MGLLLPSLDEVFFYGVVSKVTSDTLVDCLTQWWESVHEPLRRHLHLGPQS